MSRETAKEGPRTQPDDLRELIEFQKKATPGPWKYADSDDIGAWTVYGGDNWSLASMTIINDHGNLPAPVPADAAERADVNGSFIAAARNFDFQAVQEKIDRLEQMWFPVGYFLRDKGWSGVISPLEAVRALSDNESELAALREENERLTAGVAKLAAYLWDRADSIGEAFQGSACEVAAAYIDSLESTVTKLREALERIADLGDRTENRNLNAGAREMGDLLAGVARAALSSTDKEPP